MILEIQSHWETIFTLLTQIKFRAEAGQFFSLKSIINPDDKVNSAVAETPLELTMVKYEELDKVLSGTDKNLSALLKSLISQGIN